MRAQLRASWLIVTVRVREVVRIFRDLSSPRVSLARELSPGGAESEFRAFARLDIRQLRQVNMSGGKQAVGSAERSVEHSPGYDGFEL